MSKPKYWFMYERHNPQHKKNSYFLLGNIKVEDALKHSNPIYGYNELFRFTSEKEYNDKIVELTANGTRIVTI